MSTAMGPTLNGPFREMVGLGSENTEYRYNGIVWAIVWGPNKAVGIGEWAICGAGRIERLYCISKDELSSQGMI